MIDSGLRDPTELIDPYGLDVVRGTYEIAKPNALLPTVNFLGRRAPNPTEETREWSAGERTRTSTPERTRT